MLKKICLVLALTLVLATAATAAESPFSVRTALSNSPRQTSCTVAVGAGEVLDLTAADLELRMNLEPGSLLGLTVTALPLPRMGGFYLDGVDVELYDFLERSEIDRLCFAAAELTGTVTLGFLPQAKGGVATNLNIMVLAQPNHPPSLEGASVQTGRNISVSGYLYGSDPDGDPISIRLIQPPQKGEVVFWGQSFTYEPYHNKTGADSFVVRGVDSKGAYSPEVTVSVTIDKQKRSFYYTDMVVHPSQYAALMLHEAGVYTGKQVGSSYFFQPDARMSRGEFLMLLITSAGLADTMTPTVNTGLPNDQELPTYLKRYVRQAVEAKILSPDAPFYWKDIPTRAEAVVLTDRAAGISDVKSYDLTMADAAEIPDWARSAYRDLAAYKMLDLYDGFAYPDGSLTNAYAADLAWQLCKHARQK